jgi:hypothetical protein
VVDQGASGSVFSRYLEYSRCLRPGYICIPSRYKLLRSGYISMVTPTHSGADQVLLVHSAVWFGYVMWGLCPCTYLRVYIVPLLRHVAMWWVAEYAGYPHHQGCHSPMLPSCGWALLCMWPLLPCTTTGTSTAVAVALIYEAMRSPCRMDVHSSELPKHVRSHARMQPMQAACRSRPADLLQGVLK